MQRNQQDFRTEKYIRYGIRKYSFGAASVAIAAGLMFLGNGAVSATEVQNAETVVATNASDQDNKEKAEPKAETVETVKPETEKAAEVKPEVKVEEAKKVNKAVLEASIATLESKLSTAKYADATVVNSAKEVLATAKATLAKTDASQVEVDTQAELVTALSTVVVESNTLGLDKKQEAEKVEAEKTATASEKSLSEAKTVLDKALSEADVTNRLANAELSKKEVKEENKAAVEAAVAKNQVVLSETKSLLAEKSVTKEQVDAQLARLNESILAVYDELQKAGVNRNGKFEVALAGASGTTTGKVDTVKNDTIERYKNFKNYKYGASFLGVENKQQYTAYKNNGIMWYDFGKAYKSGGKFTAISNDIGKPATDISIYESTNENLKRDAQAAGVTKAAGYQLALQVGTVFEQELYPGYVVRMEVTELKPYETTDVYRERAQKAGIEVKHTKDNSEITKNSIRYDGREVDVVIQKEKEGNPKNAGIVTGNMFNRFGPARDNATVGVTWKLTRFLNGKELKGADVLLADGEQLTNTETVNYVTDGGNWELVEEANAQQNQQGDTLTGSTPSVSLDGNGGYKWPDGSYAEGYAAPLRRWSLTSADDLKQETHLVGGARNSKPEGGTEDYRDFFNRKDNCYYKAYLDLDEKGEPKLGLGTQVMSPYHTFNVNSYYNTNSAELGYTSRSSWNASKTVPIFGSRDAQHVSVYINAAGMQNAMVGFLAEDRGDAPLTYGEARHSINSVIPGTGDRIQQPYLGSALPDFERKTEVTQENGKYVSKPIETTPWTGDDDTNVTNNPGTKDEGEEQLVGVGKKYSVITLSDGTTKISFKASNGSGEFDKADGTGTKQTLSGKAYVRGWIDFNENGRFDPEEESDVVEVNGNDQDVTLRFSNKARSEAAINGKISELGTRIRIAMSKNEILVPTGTAATGEVEDFKTLSTTAPKGSVKETTGTQGEKQSSVLTFTAFGTLNTDHTTANTIDTKKLPVIVSADGVEHGQSYTVAGQGTYTVDNDGLVTFTPEPTFVGKADGIFVRRVDTNGNSTGWTSTILQDKDTAVTDKKGRSTYTSFDGSLDVTKAVEKTVTLNGAATTSMDAVYIPTVTPKELEGKNVDSTDIQGKPQKKTPTFNLADTTTAVTPSDKYPAKLVDASGNKVETLKVDGQGTYTINPTTGEVTFTPEPNFKGTAKPVTIELETAVGSDKNGTPVLKKATATYTPTVVGVVPTAEPATSTDIQGVEQSKEVTFKPGKTTINGEEKEVPIDTTSFKLLDETGNPVESVPAKNPDGKEIGTYTLKVVDGKPTAVFTPTDKTYAGEVKPVTIQAKDTNGTPVTTTYTPNITPVAPTGTPTATEGAQGQPQEGTPTFTPGDDKIPMKIDATQPAKLVDPATGNPIEETSIPAKDAKGNTVGTYTIEPTTGKVTFTPNKDFVGTPVPAKVQAKDANGTPTTATYEPTVKPVTPTGSDTVTEDVQGSIQKGKPTFEGGTVTVNGEEKTVAIDEDKPAKLVDPKTGDPVESVTIDGEGTYTVTPDGIVTFTPEKNFTGKGTGVTVQREDKNATPVTAKYTPVVKPATPTSSDVITTNVQGAIQEGTPTFTGGKVTINGQEKTVAIDEAVKPKFDDGTTEKVVPNEGTYTIDENGKVTFTPEKTFTGQAAGVTVKRVDKNGTPVTAKYTPVVIPVSPTSKDAESEGPKGQSQEGTPTFTGGKVTLNGKEVPVAIDENVKPKFYDGTTEKVVPNEGTYTIDENGKVTFTPEPNFVGKATGVTVKRVDKNGTPVTAKYTPTVRPDTRFVVIEKDGKETDLLPSKDGAKPSEPIPGYNVVRTEIDEKGNTKHIYEKVKTSFKDKEGNEIPKYPSEPGTVDKKDIPEYRFVETKKLPNGDTEHIYERVVAPTPTPTPTPTPFEYKVITTFVDENGVLIIPDENGSHPGKPLENYELVRTETDANGNVRNVYRKIQSQKPVQPVEPAKPEVPATPAQPVQPTAVKEAEGKRELPNTGTEDNASLAALGLLGVLSGFGLVARKKKED